MTGIVKLIDHASDDDWPSFDHSFVSIGNLNERYRLAQSESHENLEGGGS